MKTAFVYICSKCGRQATKPACEKPTGNLGKWNCPKCGKVPVQRQKAG